VRAGGLSFSPVFVVSRGKATQVRRLYAPDLSSFPFEWEGYNWGV
jgi:hypothetical protein